MGSPHEGDSFMRYKGITTAIFINRVNYYNDSYAPEHVGDHLPLDIYCITLFPVQINSLFSGLLQASAGKTGYSCISVTDRKEGLTNLVPF